MIEMWLRGIRDHPERPPAYQVHALAMLALRLDDRTGAGFASTQQVSDDAAVSGSTVRRATRWGRAAGYLVQTRRGHRVTADRVIASEWRLTMPSYPQAQSQQVTGDPLEKPTGQWGRPNRSRVTTHQESVSINGRAGTRARIVDDWHAGRMTTEEKRAALAALAGGRKP